MIKNYIETVQKEGPDHKRGPIHVQAAMGFLEGMLEDVTEEAVKAELKAWATAIEAEDMFDVCDTIAVFRISKTYKLDTVKLQVQITDSDIMKAWHDTLVKQGAKIKLGTPPKTELQRLIQTALDHMKDD